jgi:hypothetical protein
MGRSKIVAIIMASRKELGWLAAINTGPLIRAIVLSCMINAGQKMAKAKRIKGLSI